jgi:tetrahydromethanopterin S-methyltransferase subunit B
MVGMEERYKKYIEKAKSVIKTLDPKQTPGGGAPPEVNLLRNQLAEKDRVIDELEKESEKSKVRLYLLFSFFSGEGDINTAAAKWQKIFYCKKIGLRIRITVIGCAPILIKITLKPSRFKE